MASDKDSMTNEGSPDSCYKYIDLNYYSSKWAKSPPKIWKPFLEYFTLFSALPIEIRQDIWKLSLPARVVEVKFNVNHGYYTTVKPPAALNVSKDSRDAVKYLYPICFGTLIHEPAIVFNFSMDTLYFDESIGAHIVPFVYSWKGFEAENIQSLAIDRYLNDATEEWEYGTGFECIKTIQQATHNMPALKEVLIVTKLDDYWHEHGFPEGNGEIQLMESFSYDIQQYMYRQLFHLDDDGESKCQELPTMDDLLDEFQAPNKNVVWGWRPTDLPLEPYPWEMEDSESEGDGSVGENFIARNSRND